VAKRALRGTKSLLKIPPPLLPKERGIKGVRLINPVPLQNERF
jgi:hypothetical protein